MDYDRAVAGSFESAPKEYIITAGNAIELFYEGMQQLVACLLQGA